MPRPDAVSVGQRLPTALLAVVALCAAALPSGARAAGMTTHSETAYRASRWFTSSVDATARDWILANPGALQAGAAFPDWGYGFGQPDAAEDTHWPPYHEAAADYLHETYPLPWNDDTKKLATFLLGVRCHWVADIDWHGLGGVQEGFIDVAAAQEFDGNWSEAHGNSDTGGDFMAAYELPLDWMVTPWYVPVSDLIAIYQRLGYTAITASEITTDTSLMMLAQRGTKLGGALLLPPYAEKSPLLFDQYHDYFVGGIDGMANQTTFVWDPMISWMRDGFSASGARPSLFGRAAGPAAESPLDHDDEVDALRAGLPESVRKSPPRNLDELRKLGISVQETARGAHITAVAPAAALTGDGGPGTLAEVSPMGEDRSLTIGSAEPYAYLGSSVTVGDFDGDGRDELILGSPGYSIVGGPQLGRVRVISGRTVAGHESLDVTGGNTLLTLTGDTAYGRFGWAVALVDLNADGRLDLAVSQPTTEAQSYGYRGRVLVYFGHPGGALSSAPDVTITTGGTYTNLGYRLVSADLDGDGRLDLVVSTPFERAGGRQRGLVAVFRGSSAYSSGSSHDVSSADWLVTGAQDWGWFGFDVIAASVGVPARPYLLVGAPKYEDGPDQAAGRVYGFDLTGLLSGTASTAPVFTITGNGELDNFGTALAYGDPRGNGQKLLAASSPPDTPNATLQTGSVSLLSLDGLAGDVSLGSLAVTRIDGDSSWGRLGSRLGFVDVNGDGADELWVTEPMRLSGLSSWESGAAYLFAGGASFPTGNVVANGSSALWSMRDTAIRGVFGSALAFPDFDGDGSRDVALASRRNSAAAPEGGIVRVVLSPKLSVANVNPTQLGVATERNVVLTGSRFHAAGMRVRLVRGASVLVPTVTSVSATQVRATVTVPGGAVLGAYDVVVTDAFGSVTLAGAVQVTAAPGPVVCGVSRFPGVRTATAAGAWLGAVLAPLALVQLLRRRRRSL